MLRRIRARIPQSKTALIRQVQTGSNQTALEALGKLQAQGWTQDGSLCGLEFQGADLKDARLAKANLENIILRGADLSGAYLNATNLRGADMENAVLRGAYLGDARMSGANLMGADLQQAHLANARLQDANIACGSLQGANLWCTQLHGANLRSANLRDANLQGAVFSTQTILPDGSFWSSDADLQRFTDADHPRFWDPPVRPGSTL